jgi:PIN domain nuclease of toxin-antitoxin system
LLLDTHALIWALTEPEKLSSRARELIANAENDALVSPVSAAEMAIKARLGKLPTLTMPVSELFEAAIHQLPATELPLLARHSAAIENLSEHHRDPFDWMLIAQARVEGLTILTSDRFIRLYDVRTEW